MGTKTKMKDILVILIMLLAFTSCKTDKNAQADSKNYLQNPVEFASKMGRLDVTLTAGAC